MTQSNHQPPQPQKSTKRPITGVLLLDKPIGISSNTALQKARRIFRAEKAGHTGVLDPLASGLLPICFGEATKFAQYLLDADKSYIATLKLGEATTTGDAEGEVIERIEQSNTNKVSLADFQVACKLLTGKITQVPPMFSALKHEGKPLYEYARQGIVIERKSREIEIFRIDILEFDYPKAVIDVACSKGTYIRTLSEDIAKKINTFAHLTGLRRTKTAGFQIEQTYTLEQLEELAQSDLGLENLDKVLLPCDILLQHFPKITLLNDDLVTDLKCGRLAKFEWTDYPNSSNSPNSTDNPIRIYNKNQTFIGLATYSPKHQTFKALRLMNTH